MRTRPELTAAGRSVVTGLMLLGGAALVGLLIGTAGGLRIALAAGAGALLAVFALRVPRLALAALIVWFVALGLIRRLISGLDEKAAYGDPLILVGAMTWTVLAVVAVSRGALVNRSRLTTAVVALATILAASAVNPLQGGLTVGLSGVLLVVVPMAAFLIGRGLVDDRVLRRLFVLVAWLGPVVAAYGLYQTFLRLPGWDQRWVTSHGYTALNVGGTIRAFASFSAASEYASFLGIAIVVWVARTRGLARTSVAVAVLALLAVALWFESARGAIVLTVVAVGLVLAARAGLGLGRSLLVGGAVLVALPSMIGLLAPTTFSDGTGDRLAQHQIEGLTDPFGKNSTLPVHIELTIRGLGAAVEHPLGVGVGSVTIGSEKYGGTARPTEGDPGNVAVAAGLPGLLAYLVVIVLAIPRLYRLAARKRDALSLAALGIVVVTSLQWLNGGHYATAFWPWLLLGWCDARAAADQPAAVAAQASSADAPAGPSTEEAAKR